MTTHSPEYTLDLVEHHAPFRSTAIEGIMNYYSIQYDSEKQKVMFFRNLGESVPLSV